MFSFWVECLKTGTLCTVYCCPIIFISCSSSFLHSQSNSHLLFLYRWTNVKRLYLVHCLTRLESLSHVSCLVRILLRTSLSNYTYLSRTFRKRQTICTPFNRLRRKLIIWYQFTAFTSLSLLIQRTISIYITYGL